MADGISTRHDDGVLEVTLNRPKVANAIDWETSRLMGDTFQAFRDNPDLRVAILRSASDRHFCAGWDLKTAAAAEADGAAPVNMDFGPGGFGGIQDLRDLNKPVIACVNGVALGGGFELALSCDLIYASEHSSFGLSEIIFGTLAPAACARLHKRMPWHIAMELLFTGRRMDAAEAHRWGLVNEVVPKDKIEERVWAIAKLLAGGSPLVLAAIKETVRVSETASFADTINRISRHQLATVERLEKSEDTLEGRRAFAEKRQPIWKGR
ncbi:enoyl-CoA hydratase-related protein [Mesorhizobium sp. M0622]|uniref:enoyl-CoA hydratase-related protein n=1 Tax=Mesorhizobium sp. M0622 TaxID=2956975 RepID=UPI0033369631